MIIELLLVCLIPAVVLTSWYCSRKDYRNRYLIRQYREALLQVNKKAKLYADDYGEASWAMGDIVEITDNVLENSSC